MRPSIEWGLPCRAHMGLTLHQCAAPSQDAAWEGAVGRRRPARLTSCQVPAGVCTALFVQVDACGQGVRPVHTPFYHAACFQNLQVWP